jgi:hypothetical protein
MGAQQGLGRVDGAALYIFLYKSPRLFITVFSIRLRTLFLFTELFSLELGIR